MNTKNKTSLFKPMSIVVILLSSLFILNQLYSMIRTILFFTNESRISYDASFFLTNAIIGIVISTPFIVILFSIIKSKRSVALFTFAIFNIVLATSLLTSMFKDDFYITDAFYFTVFLINAIIFILAATRKVKMNVALSVSIISQLLYIIISFLFIYTNLTNIFLLFFSSALIICCMYNDDKETLKSSLNLQNSHFIQFEQKNIATYVLLSIITFGLYGIIWMIDIVRDVHKLHQNEEPATSEVLLMIFIPFYTCYWMYKNGTQMYKDSNRLGGNISDNGALYMILSLFGLTIVNYALIQNSLNNFEIVKSPENNFYHTTPQNNSFNYTQQSNESFAPTQSLNDSSISNKLIELQKIKDASLITNEEYEIKRSEILSRL